MLETGDENIVKMFLGDLNACLIEAEILKSLIFSPIYYIRKGLTTYLRVNKSYCFSKFGTI